MKKQLFYILLICLYCQFTNTQQPTGSFQKTSYNIKYSQRTKKLTALCEKWIPYGKHGKKVYVKSSLIVEPTATDVENCHGKLQRGPCNC
jgi:hypothetical protein